jgi:bifunctional DNA-binding transcriptional regulator/antitoxin component of YhaV-PrlF toxin-antitoxin module
MPRSTITSKRQTTVPKEVCDVLDVGPGDKITWEVNGGRVAVTTERPAFWRWVGTGGFALLLVPASQQRHEDVCIYDNLPHVRCALCACVLQRRPAPGRPDRAPRRRR